ncbi:MAG: phage portal protein [Galactobacter sp.]
MPLPETNVVWPPERLGDLYEAVRTNDAWYTGDTGTLADIYRGQTRHVRPSQAAGGVVGAVARWFWGKPQHAGEQRTRLHIPVAADIATTSADLLFSEAPRILFPDSVGEQVRARTDAIVNTPSMHSRLLEAAEVAAALTGVFLRVVWDTEFEDHAMVDVVHPDKAVPEWRWGRLAAVTFWTVVSDDGKRTVRHLERHEPGRILHGLYVGETGQLGRQVPLDERPETAYLADLVDAEGGIKTGVDGLTAAYITNIKPSRRWRANADLAPYGRSDFEGVEPLFDAFDEVYSSWMRDIRLAKARLIVPEGMTDTRGRGQGVTFDEDREIFTEAPGAAGALKDAGVQAQQFEIRVEEHRATAIELLRAILRAAGYSPSTFGDDPMAVSTTATEVKARERMSERTRDKKSRYWAAALAPFIRTLINVDAAVFGGQQVTELPEVKFQETTQKDPLELAQVANQLRAAQAASTETLVRMQHPNWDRDTVNKEVARVQSEVGFVVDPTTLDRS